MTDAGHSPCAPAAAAPPAPSRAAEPRYYHRPDPRRHPVVPPVRKNFSSRQQERRRKIIKKKKKKRRPPPSSSSSSRRSASRAVPPPGTMTGGCCRRTLIVAALFLAAGGPCGGGGGRGGRGGGGSFPSRAAAAAAGAFVAPPFSIAVRHRMRGAVQPVQQQQEQRRRHRHRPTPPTELNFGDGGDGIVSREFEGAFSVVTTASPDDDDDVGEETESVSDSSRRKEEEEGQFIVVDDDPLLDSTSRRLRRLQKLDDQNSHALFATAAAMEEAAAQSSSREAPEGQQRRSSSAPSSSSSVDRRGGRESSATATATTAAQDNGLVLDDATQLNSILSTAPAVLLQSGPGTGKSSVLSARIAHLLREDTERQQKPMPMLCRPENMIIVSFTNRDAEVIKERALDLLFPPNPPPGESEEEHNNPDDDDDDGRDHQTRRKELHAKLWSGTMHAFSTAILRRYGGESLRVVSTREMRNRVKVCLQRMIRPRNDDVHNAHGAATATTRPNDDNHSPTSDHLRTIRSKFKDAMDDADQNMGKLITNVIRCVELWKEAGMLPTPTTQRCAIRFGDDGGHGHGRGSDDNGLNTKSEEEDAERDLREDCIELAMRLGVPPSAALLALDLYPEYQAMHAASGTADPSDLASMARDFLLANPRALVALRSKLKHVILDEYQDISVSQHSLLRLIVRGRDDDDCEGGGEKKADEGGNGGKRRSARKPILLDDASVRRRSSADKSRGAIVCYDVPRLFCAGDANQSLYGWRGAAPSLTVDGFLVDYPQGVCVPLGTNYRLPRNILNAANVLAYGEGPPTEASFRVSPAGSKARKMLQMRHTEDWPAKNDFCVGEQLLLAEGNESEPSSTVLIQGLWDAREEAKFIASTIRKRSKERTRHCVRAFLGRGGGGGKQDDLFDPTDVAIMVRSGNQMKLVQEALTSCGIPCVFPNSESESDMSRSSQSRKTKSLNMKPVKLITMHRAKGDEFDDVYLYGWTEGVFPHPSSVSSNRIHEERRLAYVALTRARQRVVITYSFVRRVAYIGPHGERKQVTGQVKPSRFLYQLMPPEEGSARRSNVSVNWSENYGFKEFVAGKDLPAHFVKSYQTPDGYRAETDDQSKTGKDFDVTAYVAKHETKSVGQSQQVEATHVIDTTRDFSLNEQRQLMPQPFKEKGTDDHISRGRHHLDLIQHGLIEMIDLRIKGSCNMYSETFRTMLQDTFDIERGSALVFADKKRGENTAVDALFTAPENQLITKALSRCTAKQLGHYVAYLILSSLEE